MILRHSDGTGSRTSELEAMARPTAVTAQQGFLHPVLSLPIILLTKPE